MTRRPDVPFWSGMEVDFANQVSPFVRNRTGLDVSVPLPILTMECLARNVGLWNTARRTRRICAPHVVKRKGPEKKKALAMETIL